MLFFFFQAEDGIRDKLVTGVQTCALPISLTWGGGSAAAIGRVAERADEQRDVILLGIANLEHDLDERMRSEERRVGKSVDLGGRRIIKKKNRSDKERHPVRIESTMTTVCE